jgi:hypothetical protein
MGDKPYVIQILSLGGGGIRSECNSRLLASFEATSREVGHLQKEDPFRSCFDLLSGTPMGSDIGVDLALVSDVFRALLPVNRFHSYNTELLIPTFKLTTRTQEISKTVHLSASIRDAHLQAWVNEPGLVAHTDTYQMILLSHLIPKEQNLLSFEVSSMLTKPIVLTQNTQCQENHCILQHVPVERYVQLSFCYSGSALDDLAQFAQPEYLRRLWVSKLFRSHRFCTTSRPNVGTMLAFKGKKTNENMTETVTNSDTSLDSEHLRSDTLEQEETKVTEEAMEGRRVNHTDHTAEDFEKLAVESQIPEWIERTSYFVNVFQMMAAREFFHSSETASYWGGTKLTLLREVIRKLQSRLKPRSECSQICDDIFKTILRSSKALMRAARPSRRVRFSLPNSPVVDAIEGLCDNLDIIQSRLADLELLCRRGSGFSEATGFHIGPSNVAHQRWISALIEDAREAAFTRDVMKMCVRSRIASLAVLSGCVMGLWTELEIRRNLEALTEIHKIAIYNSRPIARLYDQEFLLEKCIRAMTWRDEVLLPEFLARFDNSQAIQNRSHPRANSRIFPDPIKQRQLLFELARLDSASTGQVNETWKLIPSVDELQTVVLGDSKLERDKIYELAKDLTRTGRFTEKWASEFPTKVFDLFRTGEVDSNQ